MRIPSVLRLLPLAALALCAVGCKSNPDRIDRPENPFKTAQEGPGAKSPLSDKELRLQADQLYRHAREALDSSDYTTAITRYDQLIARYPFSDYSTQAELEKIYSLYKSFKPDEALSAADRFLRAHPRHPHADYVQYLKGVTDFDRDQGLLSYIDVNTSKRDVSSLRRAFEDFALLLQRYPATRYAGDARRRMLFARNRIADHELSVAQFYVDRGAYVAAAKRATDIVADYPGAPATADALKILEHSYAKLGLQQQAKDAATLIAMNTVTVQYADAPPAPVLPASADQTLAAAPPPAAMASAAPPNGEHPGLVTRFTHLFDRFDTSKPENQHTVTVGGNQAAGAAAPATGGNAPPAAPGSALHLSAGVPGDTDPAVANVAKTTAGDSAASQAKPADAQAPAAQQPGRIKAFFNRFTGLFTFLDPTKSKPAPPPAPAPADSKPAQQNSDTTK